MHKNNNHKHITEYRLQIPIYNDLLIIQSHKNNLPKNVQLPEFANAGFWRDNEGLLHIWLSENINIYKTIPHECLHIANLILAERNVIYYPTQDEVLAYLLGFLCSNVFSAYFKLYVNKEPLDKEILNSEPFLETNDDIF